MTSITFNVSNDEIAEKIIIAMRELGLEAEEEQEMTLAEFENYLYHGNEEAKTGERLMVLRKEKKLSLRKLEEITSIPYRHISEMENGKRSIGKKNAQKLAKALNADYRFLM